MELPIPKGYESVNDAIEFSGVELLNAASSDPSAQARDLLGEGMTATESDADSQLLLYIPFMNNVQVASILLKVNEESQVPNRAKVWNSLPAALSFEDAESQKAPFDGAVSSVKEGWREIKLRFVLFQNVSSLLVFLDGEDPDTATVLERLVIVGRKGQTRAQGPLQSLEDED